MAKNAVKCTCWMGYKAGYVNYRSELSCCNIIGHVAKEMESCEALGEVKNAV